ncbi:hypothetical protein KAU37_08810 [Candidatus Bipolaricaulota bacterium]|nr:hypothetical protein [Candidatus Bipolaricaulota bacterium]
MELLFDCKKPKCDGVLEFPSVPGVGGPTEFNSEPSARHHLKERWKDERTRALAIKCPKCERIYLYDAKDAFIGWK